MSASLHSPVLVPGAADYLSFDIVKTLPVRPHRLTAEPAWQGHIPFARWLIQMTRPRSVVELGVYKGDSYCTFCETVVRLGLDTRCQGIDAWRGDAHTGFYGDEIYRDLSAYHDPRYGAFSRLTRALFDTARDDVADGSIDLLHIDGLHTYEAVRHDFDTWLPKVSRQGVVLFHDTAVLQDGFGVWRLWEELVERYPHFSFPHSNGLGVLVVGPEAPPALCWLTSLDTATADDIRAFFASLGVCIQQEWTVSRLEDQGRGLAIRLQHQNAALHRLSVALNDTVAQMSQAMLQLSQRHEMALWEERVRTIQDYAVRLEEEIRAKNQKLDAVYASRSWQVTAPLRRVVSVRGLFKRAVRGALTTLPGGDVALDQARLVRDRLRNRRSASPTAPDLLAAKEAFRDQSAARFTAFMDSAERLQLPCSAHPKVTVVLVLWNQAPLTLACLQGLAREFDVSLDVVIVDNASTDQTGALLDRLNGAHIIRNDENLGFLKAVNQGIAAARGGAVLLLNNDAVMRPGTLAAALETLDSSASIGAVGGRVILPHGRLQEAGSIIWQDGSCLGYARNEDPECSEAMFRRDVDYCSGVFLLFRRSTFEALGGFDEAFAPAYYEETDFCLRLWENGLRVVYDPRAVVDHFEFGSSEKSEHALALQTRNRTIFLAKHDALLKAQAVCAPEAILKARRRDAGQGRVLFIDDRVPLRALGAGYPRARHLVREMVDSGRFVTFYPMQTPTEDWDETYNAIPLDVEVAMDHGLAGFEAFMTARHGYYDTIFVSRPHNMKPVAKLHKKRPDLFAGVRIIYDAEAVFAVRELLKAKLFKDIGAAKRAEADIGAELALTQVADHIVAVSEAEARHFRADNRSTVHVIGHGMTPDPTLRSFAERRDLLFVGALDDEESPNVDSLVWFVTMVLPRVQARLDQAVGLVVAGRNKAPSVQALGGRFVNLLGSVASLDDVYSKARVFVAPTRFAGGIPHKVHEAAARGVPVVATSLLATQLGWQDGVEVLVADDPETFAMQVARLYDDAALWESVRAAALARVALDCDPLQFRNRVRAVLDAR